MSEFIGEVTILEVDNEEFVIVEEPVIEILETAEQGPIGPRGDKGDKGESALDEAVALDPLAYYILSKN